jgi:hypothetical protein
MKYILLKMLPLCALSFCGDLHAEGSDVNYNGDVILEVRLEDMASNPNPDDVITGWSAFVHPVAGVDPGDLDIAGQGVSNYVVGSGLWFGLFAMNDDGTDHDLIASTVVGSKPSAIISFTTKDTNSDPASPRTRVDVPFGVSVKVIDLSDDILLDGLENGEEFAPSTKVMNLSLVTKDDEDIVVDNGVVDYLSDTDEAFALTQTTVDDGSSVTRTNSEIFSYLTSDDGNKGIKGSETIEAYVMVNEDVNNPNWLIKNSATIRILPTAYASEFNYDGADKVLQSGDVLNATPTQISVWGYQLYPGSKTRMTMFKESGGSTTLVYNSAGANDVDAFVVTVDDVQDQRFIAGQDVYEIGVDDDDATYTVNLETTTVFDDEDGDGVSEWVLLKSTSFTLDREVLVRGRMVSGSK